MHTQLTRKGYIIPKSDLNGEQIKELVKELTAIPVLPPTYSKKTNAFKCLRESTRHYYLPRYYGVKKFGEPKEIHFNDYNLPKNLGHTIVLKDYQKDVVDVSLKHIKEFGGGVISLACGMGKTVCALYMLMQLKKKTLVVVHKNFLLDQWVQRIKQFIPNARIGTIQGAVIDTTDKDIVIAMLQSVSMRTYDPAVFADFGTIIVDENHHISTEVFSKALPKIAARYTIGLSATPVRQDKLEKVVFWYLGDIIYKLGRDDTDCVLVKRVHFQSNNDLYIQEHRMMDRTLNHGKMISQIANYAPRNRMIVHEILYYVREEGRQILVMSDRRDVQLKRLKMMLDGQKAVISRNGIERPLTIGMFLGGQKKSDREKSETCDVILATYGVARDGLDIKTLNTLLLATPVTDIEQACGRILRENAENGTRPLIIDISDSFSVFLNQSKKRLKFYKSKTYKVSDFYYKENAVFNSLEISSKNLSKVKVNSSSDSSKKEVIDCKAYTFSDSE